MNDVLVSVIIPVYNVEEYLEECLDSVLNQTYKNIEVIAINDGSTDNSPSILESYAIENENITIISQKNSGQSIARNNGIKIANGKYIYFLDSDDYILPETFEQLVRTMEENDLDLIRFTAESFTDNINIPLIKDKYNFDEYFEPNKIYNKEEFLKSSKLSFSASPVLYIIKRDVLIRNNILFKPGIVHEDELFTVEVFLNVEKTMYDPSSFYKRRYRPNSTMTSNSLKSKRKSFESRCIVVHELNKLLEKYTAKNEVKLIKKRIRSVIASLVYNYDDLELSYRKVKLKSLENKYITYYYLIRKIITNTIKKLFKR